MTSSTSSSSNLYTILFMISAAFNPIFWNFVARLEYQTHFLTRACGGSKYSACYLLAFTIFSLGILRDYLYKLALNEYPDSLALTENVNVVYAFAVCLLAIGNVLVLTSMWKLGITGTYLGDYFGILMNKRVTSFPFSIMENPMYNGSTMIFLGSGLILNKWESIYLSAYVYLVYQLALKFEGPFTAKIYARQNKKA